MFVVAYSVQSLVVLDLPFAMFEGSANIGSVVKRGSAGVKAPHS